MINKMTDEHLINKAEAFLKHGTAPEILPGDEFPRLIALARLGAKTKAKSAPLQRMEG